MFVRNSLSNLSKLSLRGSKALSTSACGQSSKANWIPFVAAGAVALAGYSYYQHSNKLSAESKALLTGGDQWVDIKVKDVITVNHNVKRVIFQLPSPDQTLGLTTASCVLTKFVRPENGKPVIRPYTPISDPAETGEFEMIIKSYKNGLMSNHIHGLAPGDVLSFKGPIMKYKWEPNLHKEIALLGGGTGIAPLYQLVHSIASNPADKTKVHLFFANISEDDILLRQELEDVFSKKPDQFKLHLFVEKPSKTWKGQVGYISKDYLSKQMFPASDDNVKVFVCGPPPFYEAISGNKVSPTDQGELKGHLKDLGFTKEQVFKF